MAFASLVRMPRKNLIRSHLLPYHVTARGNNREAFHCGIERAWKVLLDEGFALSLLYGVEIHALVLMPNHFHMIVTVRDPNHDLGEVMQHFMRSATRTLNSYSDRTGRAFGARYHWSLIDSTLYFAHAYKYLYRNPVRAGLCPRVEDYPFSTLKGLLGSAWLPFPLHYPFGMGRIPGVPEDSGKSLEWLNRPSASEHEEWVRKGLKKTTFSPPTTGWTRSLGHFEQLKFYDAVSITK